MDRSYIQYLITGYWTTLRSNRFNQPIFTDLMRITESIVSTHFKGKSSKEKENIEKRLEFLNQYTHEDIRVSLAALELAVFKNWLKSGDAEITLNNEEYPIGYLFDKLNNVIQELTRIVSDIAANYSLDIEMKGGLFGDNASFAEDKQSLGGKKR